MTIETTDITEQGTEQRRSLLTRRNVVRTGVWAVPAISVVTAAPAFAAFSGASALSLGAVTFASSNFSTTTTDFHVWNGTTYTAATKAVTTITNPAVLTVTIGGPTASGTGNNVVTLTVTLSGQSTTAGTTTTTRGLAQYGQIVGSDWVLMGTPTLNNTTKVATYVFVSTAAAQANQKYPDLTFSVDNGSGSAATVYAFTAGITCNVTASADGATSTTASGTF